MATINRTWDDFLYNYLKSVFYYKVMNIYYERLKTSDLEEFNFYSTDFYGDNHQALI